MGRHELRTFTGCRPPAHAPGITAVAYLGGGACARPTPFGRTAVIFVSILGLFLAPFRDKIAATSDHAFFGPENALKCVCGAGELTAPQRCQPVYC